MTMTQFGERQRARCYIYKNQNKFERLYIYSKSQTLFKKQDNLRYVFIHKKPHTLHYTIFREFLKLAFMYTKIMTLCVT